MKDQELEKLMRQIATDAALDDGSTDEIADSPALWWSVQRETRKATTAKAPWPPNVLRRWLMVAVPVAAVLLTVVVFYVNSVRLSSDDRAQNSPSDAGQTKDQPIDALIGTPDLPTGHPPITFATTGPPIGTRSNKAVARTRNVTAPRTLTAKAAPRSATEIKSEFIALAYSRSPESGQLVRVKVPSSMMVQLGLVSTVDKPAELVDAEVLVGDDGLTHAIRFIRQ